MAMPCVLPSQWGEYEERAKLTHATLKLDIRKNFLTMRIVRGLKEITVSRSFGLNVHREEKLRKRKHLPPLVVLGPQLLTRAQRFPEPGFMRLWLTSKLLRDVCGWLLHFLQAPD